LAQAQLCIAPSTPTSKRKLVRLLIAKMSAAGVMPAMTSMVMTQPQYGVPATYAAAPTMTSMYAQAPQGASMYAQAPGASMYLPATTSMAAAPMVAAPMVAAPVTTMTMTPSYIPQPVAPQVAYSQFAMPLPAKLTEGLVEPAKLEAEKAAYAKALEAQLKKQSDALFEEANLKKAMVDQQAKTELAQIQLQIEEQLKMSCLSIDHEAQNMCAALQEAAITQQTAQDEMTAIKVADFTKKKALEDMSQQMWQTQRQWFDQEVKMVENYRQVMRKEYQLATQPYRG